MFWRFLRTSLVAITPAVAFGGSFAQAQTPDSWRVPEIVFNSFEDLSKAQLKTGVVYRVVTLGTDPPSKTGIFYAIPKPLPSNFSAGTVTQTPTGRLLFRPTSQSPEIRAEWFGAVGDGVKDDTFAIRDALTYFDRVDLLDKTYGVGKGLRVTYSWLRGEILSQDYEHLNQAIPLEAGDKVFGMGPRRTTVKLLDRTNPRPDGRVFSVFGTLNQQDAANVVIRGLHIDVNFDGQSKSPVPPPDSLVTQTIIFTNPPSTNGLATLNAINLRGSNPLIEDLLVTGYSSNTENESFVILTELPFHVPLVSRQCGTIRNIEMTKPGSNLEVKYGRFGREALQANPSYQHIGEITHVTVSGAVNFSSTQLKYSDFAVPFEHEAWSRVVEVQTMTEALALRTLAPQTIVRVLRPDPTLYVYEPNSTNRSNEVSSFALGRGLFDVLPGRVSRAPQSLSDEAVSLTFESVSQMVDTLSSLPQQALPPDKAIIKVLNSTPESVEYYLTDLEPRPLLIPATSYVSGSGPTKILHFRRIPARSPTCRSWNCDTAYDPRWLGENASNIIFCEGGLVENITIHDESMNSEGYSPDGKRYGLLDPQGVNASHLHGITAAATRGLIVRGNRLTNFHGIGLFIMSWWNEGVTVERNRFDGVFSGITLASFIEDSEQKPLQFPRHRGILIKDNYIRLGNFPTSPRGYTPTGFHILDTANGETYPESLPLAEYPRFESIEFRGNRIHGRPYRHIDQGQGTVYPLAGFIRSNSYMKDITIADNVVDLKANPELIPAANKNNRLLSTAFVIAPGYWYERGLRSRQDILFFNNRDLVSLLSDDARVESAFKALDAAPIRWSIPRALPILLNDSWIPYKVGVERTGSSEEPPLKQLRD